MKVRKQFEALDASTFASPVDSVTDNFMPELSMNVKEILSQFAFVDNVRLQDLMKQGYQSQDDDSDFDFPDFDALDIAEKEELYNKSVEYINRFHQMQEKKQDEAKQDEAKQDEAKQDEASA